MGAQLRLVQPKSEKDVASNRQKMAKYVARLIHQEFAPPYWKPFFDPQYALDVELWYWFDDINLVHNLAVIGDDFSAGDVPQRAYSQLRFLLPILLFSTIRIRGNTDSLTPRMGSIFPSIYRATADEANAPSTGEIADWLLHSVQNLTASTIKELTQDIDAAVGEDWKALMVLVTRFKNIPAVPIPKAAAVLQIEEKTVRNRISRKELEAIPRMGALWVTIRSIKHYLKTHYHSTANFDVLSEVEKELRKTL